MGTRAGLVLLLAIGLCGGPGVAGAQDTRTFGTTSSISHALGAFAFSGIDALSTARIGSTGAGTRFCSGGPCNFETSVMLPEGAVVAGFELAAAWARHSCDTPTRTAPPSR